MKKGDIIQHPVLGEVVVDQQYGDGTCQVSRPNGDEYNIDPLICTLVTPATPARKGKSLSPLEKQNRRDSAVSNNIYPYVADEILRIHGRELGENWAMIFLKFLTGSPTTRINKIGPKKL